ncbi:MAG: ABC transporter ATP-binding protein [Halobacteriaceae archaeon]
MSVRPKRVLTAIRPSLRALLWGAVVVNTELLLVLTYLVVSGAGVTDPLFYVWPFVWINAAIWALFRVDRPAGSPQASLLVGMIAALYFIVLAYFGGLWSLGGTGEGFSLVLQRPPGWGPAAVYSGTAVTVVLTPFKLIGYATLTYLVGLSLLVASRAAWSGLVGVFSCVSCSWPILATVLTGVFGSASAVGSIALGNSYALSTVAFVSAVALLVWRPVTTTGGR